VTAAVTCVGEPISWLRLERFALDAADAAVGEHVARCAACRNCLDDIRADVVALPALPVVARKRRTWWVWGMPALAAAAVLVVWLARPRPQVREDSVAIKGIGDVVIDLVRERGGVIAESARSFAPGDRWKVVVTCPPSAGAWLDVEVTEIGGGAGVDYPLAPAHVACGNHVVIPGAFTLTGSRANRVCVRVDATIAPVRGAGGDTACVTVSPE
jgi:hypothetical protein